MIALLAHRPVRIKNFAAIRLGRQLVLQGERYWLVFAAEETKTGQPWEAVFPEALLPYLARYLDHHRPVLLRGERGTEPADIDALWVSEVGTQLELGALATRIRKHTDRAFGVSLPPHWFRDAAATIDRRRGPQACGRCPPRARPCQPHHHRALLQPGAQPRSLAPAPGHARRPARLP